MSQGKKYLSPDDWRKKQEEDVRQRRFKKPLTANHLAYKKAIESNRYVICTGYAGCGKTYLACEVGVRLVNERKIDKIIITRPLVECGGKVGFLPGNIDEKTGPYLAPMTAALKEILTEKIYEEWKVEGKILIYPIEYMRGSTHTDALVIVDEAQNATFEQLRMVMTRLGHNCIMAINGDTTQNDLKYISPLIRVCDSLSMTPTRNDISFIHMERSDCLRPEIIQFVDERLSGDYSGDECGNEPDDGPIQYWDAY